jgi:tetratricopeptide (TPR) repeat protein
LELPVERPKSVQGFRSRIALYVLLAICIIVVSGFGITLAIRSALATPTSAIKRWTITPRPTATETTTILPLTSGPAPLSILLNATFTPTPMYVATPHNRVEAYGAGIRAYNKGDWASAINYFKQVLADEPNDTDVYYHLGDIYRFQGAYTDALTAYQRSLKLDPNFAPGYLGEAQVYLYGPANDTKKALSALQKAVNLDPQLNQAYLELANISLAQDDPGAALEWLANLDTSLPNNSLVELDRAKAYLAESQLDQALNAVLLANQYDRSSLPVYTVWAQILQENGDYQGSIEPLLTVLANAPSDLNSQVLLARAYYETGDTDKALSLVSSCLQTDNKFIDAYLLRADIYLAENNVNAAHDDFESVVRLDYNNFDGNVGLGRVYLAKGQPGPAYNAFDYSNKLAITDTQKATILYWKAMALIGLGDTAPAIREFQAAMAFGNDALPLNLRTDAQNQMNALYTPTPSLTPTKTPVPSKTPTITLTPRRSATTTPPTTPTQSATLTSTPTPRSSATSTPSFTPTVK